MSTYDLIHFVSAIAAVTAVALLSAVCGAALALRITYERTASPASHRDAGDAAPVSNTGAKQGPRAERTVG